MTNFDIQKKVSNASVANLILISVDRYLSGFILVDYLLDNVVRVLLKYFLKFI